MCCVASRGATTSPPRRRHSLATTSITSARSGHSGWPGGVWCSANRSEEITINDMDKPSYVALVTGGNRGIGLEVCRQLAAHGYRVVLGARTRDKVDAGLEAAGGSLDGVVLDVTKPKTIASAAADLHRRFGRVDVLVNNAAVLAAENVSMLETSTDDLRTTFETNVFGAIAVAQAFVPE